MQRIRQMSQKVALMLRQITTIEAIIEVRSVEAPALGSKRVVQIHPMLAADAQYIRRAVVVYGLGSSDEVVELHPCVPLRLYAEGSVEPLRLFVLEQVERKQRVGWWQFRGNVGVC